MDCIYCLDCSFKYYLGVVLFDMVERIGRVVILQRQVFKARRKELASLDHLDCLDHLDHLELLEKTEN